MIEIGNKNIHKPFTKYENFSQFKNKNKEIHIYNKI